MYKESTGDRMSKGLMAVSLFLVAAGIFAVKNELDKVAATIKRFDSVMEEVQATQNKIKEIEDKLDKFRINFEEEKAATEKFKESMAVFAKNTVLQLQGLPK